MDQYFKTTLFRPIWKNKVVPNEQKMIINKLEINDINYTVFKKQLPPKPMPKDDQDKVDEYLVNHAI